MYLMELPLELLFNIIDYLPHRDIRQLSLTAGWMRRLVAPTLFKTIYVHRPDQKLYNSNILDYVHCIIYVPFLPSNPWEYRNKNKGYVYHDVVPDQDIKVFERIVSRCKNVNALGLKMLPPTARPAFGYKIETRDSIRRSLQVLLAGLKRSSSNTAVIRHLYVDIYHSFETIVDIDMLDEFLEAIIDISRLHIKGGWEFWEPFFLVVGSSTDRFPMLDLLEIYECRITRTKFKRFIESALNIQALCFSYILRGMQLALGIVRQVVRSLLSSDTSLL